MTKEEILSAVSMRIDGYTWRSIARELHYTDCTIRNSIKRMIDNPKRQPGGRFMYVIYPNVRNWMRDEGVSCTKISKGIFYTDTAVRDQLSGRSRINPILIRKIMKMSGMTYEEVISLEGRESDA